MKVAEDYGLPVPEFQVFDDMFRVNLFRKLSPMPEPQSCAEAAVEFGVSSVKVRYNFGDDINTTQQKILELLSEDAQMNGTRLAERIGVSKRSIEINIRKLKERGILIRHGSPKSGYWEIL